MKQKCKATRKDGSPCNAAVVDVSEEGRDGDPGDFYCVVGVGQFGDGRGLDGIGIGCFVGLS